MTMRLSLLAILLLLVPFTAALEAQVPRRGRQEGPPAKAPKKRDPTKRWGTGIAARVNRRIITEAEVWKELRGAIEGLPAEKRARAYEEKLMSMIYNAVLDQATERHKMQVSATAVQSFVEDQKEALGGEKAFQDYLLEEGVTEEEYVTDVTQRSQRNLYLKTKGGARGALGPELRPEFSVDPTMSEIRAYYKKNLKKEFTRGAEAKVMAMALTRRQFGPEMEKVIEKAKDIAESLRTGADFRTLARRYSRLAEDKGGDLGWIDKNSSLSPAIVKYAFEGPVGEPSPPIEYRSGVFVVVVEERREERVVTFNEAQRLIQRKIRQTREARNLAAIQRDLFQEAYIWPIRYKRGLLRSLAARQR